MRFLDLADFEKELEKGWNTQYAGSSMFQVCAKIKNCRVGLLKLRQQSKMNSGKDIQDVKR